MDISEIAEDSINIIDSINSFEYDIRFFINEHNEYFSNIPKKSLLNYQYTKNGVTDESSYIFMVGSYIYYKLTGNPVTWLERRRFANFSFQNELNILFKKTLTPTDNRFTDIIELKDYLYSLK